MKGSRTIIIAAGGTGGHIYPALAVAKRLHAEGYEVIWLGAHTPVETRILAGMPWRYEKVVASPFRGRGVLAKLWALFALVLGIGANMVRFIRWQPACVLTTGGYVGLGAGLAAKILGVTLLVSEQNAKAGTVNKLLAPLAKTVFTAYPGVFPGVDSRVLVESGNPIRQEMEEMAEKKRHKGTRHGKSPFVIVVIGGSQGASILNTQVPTLLGAMVEKPEVKVYHQCGQGKEKVSDIAKVYHKQGLACEVQEYYDDMMGLYQGAHVVIARAGALSLSEIAALGIPSVIVPLANAIDNHQLANARYYEDRGACWLLEEHELAQGRKLANLVMILRNSAQRYDTMQAACRKVAPLGAADKWVKTCRLWLDGK